MRDDRLLPTGDEIADMLASRDAESAKCIRIELPPSEGANGSPSWARRLVHLNLVTGSAGGPVGDDDPRAYVERVMAHISPSLPKGATVFLRRTSLNPKHFSSTFLIALVLGDEKRDGRPYSDDSRYEIRYASHLLRDGAGHLVAWVAVVENG